MEHQKNGHHEHLENVLETSHRIAELSPDETLKKLGLGRHDVACDIGAGTGLFTIPAAKVTDKTVFAVDIRQDLPDITCQV